MRRERPNYNKSAYTQYGRPQLRWYIKCENRDGVYECPMTRADWQAIQAGGQGICPCTPE
jgi:hypothetical protein